ncbi:DUF4235 domain-containing protein [Mycobacterium sp. WMMD1722]|uniref:DUF4235 domain-containing protein n=1 Tax=Mycobacterium sp. WMMD1722 TaxID=3404117 RepID=UPI003BF5F0C5
MFEDRDAGNEFVVSAAKTLYKPLTIASSIGGGLLAGKIFTLIWERLHPEGEEPPEATDLSTSARDVFLTAALQGLIVGVVRAAVARTQAKGFRALTNEDPEV